MAKKKTEVLATAVNAPAPAQSTDAFLAGLAAATTAPDEATHKTKKSTRPTIKLTDAEEIRAVNILAAAKTLETDAKKYKGMVEDDVKGFGLEKVIIPSLETRMVQENPTLATDIATLQIQVKGPYKPQADPKVPGALDQALEAAGVSKPVQAVVKRLVTVKQATTFVDFQTLCANPETKVYVDLIAEFIRTKLPPQAVTAIIKNEPEFVVDDDYQAQLVAGIHDSIPANKRLAEYNAVWSVVRGTIATAKGDTTVNAYEYLHNLDATGAKKVTTTTKVVEKVGA